MSKCCDRCKKPIDKRDMAIIEFTFNFRGYISNISLIRQRHQEGIDNPDYYCKIATGKWELCEDCRESLSKFMLNGANRR